MPVNDAALTQRQQSTLAQLRRLTAAQLSRLWMALGRHDESSQATYIRRAGPVLAAGQNRAVDVQIAYLSRRLDEAVPFDRRAILRRAGVDLREPFFAFGRALRSGLSPEDALEAGRLRALGIGESGVQWASRAANDAVEGHQRIVGWRRVLTGQSCEWCQVVSTQRYRSSDSASFGHLRCDCGVVPIVGDRDPGRVINDQLLGGLKRSGAVDRTSALRSRRRAAGTS